MTKWLKKIIQNTTVAFCFYTKKPGSSNVGEWYQGIPFGGLGIPQQVHYVCFFPVHTHNKILVFLSPAPCPFHSPLSYDNNKKTNMNSIHLIQKKPILQRQEMPSLSSQKSPYPTAITMPPNSTSSNTIIINTSEDPPTFPQWRMVYKWYKWYFLVLVFLVLLVLLLFLMQH